MFWQFFILISIKSFLFSQQLRFTLLHQKHLVIHVVIVVLLRYFISFCSCAVIIILCTGMCGSVNTSDDTDIF